MASPLDKVAKRFKITAREARDIATAVGNIGSIVRNTPGTVAKGGKPKQLGKAVKEIKKQVKETGRAAATGKSGSRSKQYTTWDGDDAARLMKVKPNERKPKEYKSLRKDQRKFAAKISKQASGTATSMKQDKAAAARAKKKK